MNTKSIYPNLRAEMARHKVTFSQLAEALDVRPATVSSKCSGQTAFTFEETMAIKNALGTDMPVEELFEREESA